MSPKSLLRLKLAVSSLSDIDQGTNFTPVMDEIDAEIESTKVKRVMEIPREHYFFSY